jgi:hypothetical protein
MPLIFDLILADSSERFCAPLGDGCFVSGILIGGATSVVNKPYRHQSADMCPLCNPYSALRPSQDATSNSGRENQ